MDNDEKTFETFDIEFPDTSIADLRGKQSVRTTFKLSAKTISAVSIVATHLGIKQKSLFDHLIEEIQSLSKLTEKIRQLQFKKKDGVQKTYVISRKSLHYLDQMSKDFHMPRDVLVEYSVQRLLPIIDVERKKHENRKHIAGELIPYMEMGKTLLDKARKRLGEDDPVFLKLRNMIAASENTYRDIELFIERGNIIEDF